MTSQIPPGSPGVSTHLHTTEQPNTPPSKNDKIQSAAMHTINGSHPLHATQPLNARPIGTTETPRVFTATTVRSTATNSKFGPITTIQQAYRVNLDKTNPNTSKDELKDIFNKLQQTTNPHTNQMGVLGYQLAQTYKITSTDGETRCSREPINANSPIADTDRFVFFTGRMTNTGRAEYRFVDGQSVQDAQNKYQKAKSQYNQAVTNIDEQHGILMETEFTRDCSNFTPPQSLEGALPEDIATGAYPEEDSEMQIEYSEMSDDELDTLVDTIHKSIETHHKDSSTDKSAEKRDTAAYSTARSANDTALSQHPLAKKPERHKSDDSTQYATAALQEKQRDKQDQLLETEISYIKDTVIFYKKQKELSEEHNTRAQIIDGEKKKKELNSPPSTH